MRYVWSDKGKLILFCLISLILPWRLLSVFVCSCPCFYFVSLPHMLPHLLFCVFEMFPVLPCPSEHQNHARELVRKADLSQWDALVIMSGDGLLFEVINGLMEREDWQEAIQTPLGILPGGSGNALAASVHHYSQSPPAWNEELLLSCGFMLCKGLVGSLDLVSVHLASRQRLFSFLSLAWGFVADVDIESEKYRHVGIVRFLMGTLVRLASLRVYQGRLAYLPVNEANLPPSPPQLDQMVDPLIPGLDQPVPESWTVVKEEDFVLVLAMYQSHLAEDLWAAPGAMADDGLIHLFYVTAGTPPLPRHGEGHPLGVRLPPPGVQEGEGPAAGAHFSTSEFNPPPTDCPQQIMQKVQERQTEPWPAEVTSPPLTDPLSLLCVVVHLQTSSNCRNCLRSHTTTHTLTFFSPST
uniref:DAGKc domain-containing protein n=1 Tax=Monopterus albus TaxID=43700 RepID=A0A3Q3KEC3_MONAL